MMDKQQFDAILLADMDEEQQVEMQESKLYLSLWLQCFTWDSNDFEFALLDEEFQQFFWSLCRRHYSN